MQDEVRSKRLRVRRVKSEELVADLGEKALSKATVSKHCTPFRYVDVAEENVEGELQDVVVFWDFGSMQSRAKTGCGRVVI